MKIHDYAAKSDLSSLKAEIASGISIETPDAQGCTPFMIAAASPEGSAGFLREMIALGANVNARTQPPNDTQLQVPKLDEETKALLVGHGIDLNLLDSWPTGAPATQSVLSYAIRDASLDKIAVLIQAGADVTYVDQNGYSIVMNAMSGLGRDSPQDLRDILRILSDAGAPLDTVSSYGESAVLTASNLGDFSLLKYLLDLGASPEPLEWTPLFMAVAFGDLEEVKALVDKGARLDEREAWERTPFLLSVHVGRREVAEYLLRHGSDNTATGRCGKTALMYAVERDNAPLLTWLITEGWNIEETDDFGTFPLLVAAEHGVVTCVRELIRAGAQFDRTDSIGRKAINEAANPQVVKILVAAGADLAAVGSEMRAQLLGHDEVEIKCSEADYLAFRNRIFGNRNPQRMNNPFWESMVRTRVPA